MNGMPIGPPFQVPDPKSAWKPVFAPIVLTIVVEFARTGSVSTGVVQMLFAGSTRQTPIICWADAVPEVTTPANSTSGIRDTHFATVRVPVIDWLLEGGP